MAFYNEDQSCWASPPIKCFNPYCKECGIFIWRGDAFDLLESPESDDETMVTGGLYEDIDIVDIDEDEND